MCSDGSGAGDGGDTGLGGFGITGFDPGGGFSFGVQSDVSQATEGGIGLGNIGSSVTGGVSTPGPTSGVGGGSSFEPPPKEAQPEAAPEVKGTPAATTQTTTPKPKKRTRRPTILTDEQGLIYTSPGKRKSLLGG